jgi:flavorubredoxin
MAQELYKDEHHQCLMFTDLTQDTGEAVPSNQFLIVNKDTGAIIDPGGNMAYNELYLGVTRYFPPPSWPRTPTRTSSPRWTAG